MKTKRELQQELVLTVAQRNELAAMLVNLFKTKEQVVAYVEDWNKNKKPIKGKDTK